MERTVTIPRGIGWDIKLLDKPGALEVYAQGVDPEIVGGILLGELRDYSQGPGRRLEYSEQGVRVYNRQTGDYLRGVRVTQLHDNYTLVFEPRDDSGDETLYRQNATDLRDGFIERLTSEDEL